MQKVPESKSCLEFEVTRKHFFIDKKYNLRLIPDQLTMSEMEDSKITPKYNYKIDLSLTITWIINIDGQIIGFILPYKKKLKQFYGSVDHLQKLRQLLKGRIFFGGQNFKRLYSLQSEISQGQFGKVYKYQHIDKKIYAVKLINKNTTLQIKDGIDTLINEIMILQLMNHPNIIKLHEVYEDEKSFYIVMDYVDGLTLRQDLLNQKDMNFQRAQRLFKQLIEGVAYLHSMGVIHRDLKPSNIMIQQERLIIIDMGLSCFTGEQLRILPECGTVGYMAPELFKKVKNYDSKVDIFSVACIYYNMLTGKQAFLGKTDDERCKLNKAANIDLSPCLNKGQSSQTYDLLSKLFQTNPDFRLSADQTIQVLLGSPQLNRKQFTQGRAYKVKSALESISTN